jgi:hypothetical protein
MMRNSRFRFNPLSALALVVAIAIAAVTVTWLVADSRDSGASPSDAEDASSAEAAADEPVETRPDLDLSQVEWRYDGEQLYPYSSADGPAEWSEQGPATGFAHTPEGAVLAVFHIVSRTQSTMPLETRLATIDGQMVDDPARAIFRAAAESPDASEPSANPPSEQLGYILHAYSATSAVVEIGVEQAELVAGFIFTAVWSEEAGDWLLYPPRLGDDWQSEFRRHSDTATFTPWSA